MTPAVHSGRTHMQAAFSRTSHHARPRVFTCMAPGWVTPYCAAHRAMANGRVTLMMLPDDVLSHVVHYVMDPLQMGGQARVVEQSYIAGLEVAKTCRRLRHLFHQQLRSLELWQTGLISARCVASLAQRANSRVRRLVLRGCVRALDAAASHSALDAVARYCGQTLRILDVSHTGVDDADLARALQRLVGLRELRIRGCLSVSDAGVLAIARHCAQLAAVDVSELPRLGDIGMCALVKACGDTLRTLAFSWCSRVGDATLLALAKHGLALTSLTMRGLPRATNAGIEALCIARGHQLVTLDVLDCNRLHVDSYLDSVRRHCPIIAARVIGSGSRSLRQVVISSLAGNIFYVTGSDICNGKAAVYFLLVDSGTFDSFRVSLESYVRVERAVGPHFHHSAHLY